MIKRTVIATAALAACLNASAALPSLTDLAENLTSLRTWRENAEAKIEEFRERIEELRDGRDKLLALVEANKNLREQYHGGRLGQYIVTNELDRIIRVDLYADGSAWTNGTSQSVGLPRDPEAREKAEREAWERREAIIQAWEAATLPADLAALRARQRAAKREEVAE